MKIILLLLDALPNLEMPLSAKYMIEHYLKIGMQNSKTYVGIVNGSNVVFSELTEVQNG